MSEENGPVSLADAATSALADIGDADGAAQAQFEGMDFTKIKFVGVQYDTLELGPKIGDVLDFHVRGKVVAVGDEAMKDGHIRHVAKVEVDSVQPFDGS